MKLPGWARSGLILALIFLSSAVFAAEKKAAPTNANEVAIIKTSAGDMVVQFWTDAAPNTIENFKKLARSGFYNGTAFHRIMKGFMVQGGDPYTKDPAEEAQWGNGGPGYTIKDEFNYHDHRRGVISMAHEKTPNSGGSQFFICLTSIPRLNGKYTTFGKLIRGDEVLTKIGDTPVKRNSAGELSKPMNPVVIQTIKIAPAGH